MLESIFILLVVISVLFLVLTVVWESLMLGAVDIILWLVLSISVYNLEIPYQYVLSDDTVGTGLQSIQTLYPLSWLFMGMAFITFLYVAVNIIFPMLQGRFSRMM